MNKSVGLIIFSLAVATITEHAYAQSWTADVLFSRKREARIPGLVIRPKKVEVKLKPVQGRVIPYVEVTGVFKRKGWGLFHRKKWLVRPNAEDRSFTFTVPLSGKVTGVSVRAVRLRPSRKIIHGALFVKFNEYDEAIETDPTAVEEKLEEEKEEESGGGRSIFFNASLGTTYVDYQESAAIGEDISLALIQLTVKFSAIWQFAPPDWEFGLISYFSPLTLKGNNTETAVKFLGINGRIGYRIDFGDSPWDLHLMAGWYYTTMIVEGNAFGFQNMFGPQIFPVIRYVLPSGSSFYAYFKLAAISGVTLSNRELAFGTGYAFRLGNGHPMNISLDVADIGFDVDNVVVSSKSYSFSIGYSF